MAPPLEPAHTLLDFLTTIKSTSPTSFETTRLAMAAPSGLRVFGGGTIAFALTAAASTVSDTHKIYSALGNFLAGALPDRVMTAHVKSIRSTRSFATQYVEVMQRQDSGEDRTCMVVLVDFQVPDAPRKDMYEYCDAPTKSYSTVASIPRTADLFNPTGKGTLRTRTLEQKWAPEGVIGEAMKHADYGKRPIPTAQDSLPINQRTSADWFRPRIPLETHQLQAAFLAFVLDGPSSFVPLLHNQQTLDEFEAVASLDFALRFFGSDLSAMGGGKGEERTEDGNGKWWLREFKSTVASEGRTFLEAKVWDDKGRCMASMTQQDIARPKKSKNTKI